MLIVTPALSSTKGQWGRGEPRGAEPLEWELVGRKRGVPAVTMVADTGSRSGWRQGRSQQGPAGRVCP